MLSHLDDFSRILKIERNYSNNTISSYLSDLKSFDNLTRPFISSLPCL